MLPGPPPGRRRLAGPGGEPRRVPRRGVLVPRLAAGQLGDLPEGVGMVSGSLTALFQSDTLIAKGRDNTESSLMLNWTSGAQSLQLDIPELIYEPASPTVSGPAGVKATMNYRGYYTNGADATALKATLVNTVAAF